MKSVLLCRKEGRFLLLLACLAVILWGIACLQCLDGRSARTGAVGESGLQTVILDAGHGGADPGALSESGLREKDINLEIVLCLRDLFMLSGQRVILTREGDYDLSEDPSDGSGKSASVRKTEDLKARLALFEETPGAVVLSVHQNHYSESASRGAQIFYGSNPAGRELAEGVQSRLVQELQPDNHRKCRKIGKEVYILYHTTRPALLCECGFLSNPAEAEKLSDPEYQKELAFCIYAGIMDVQSGGRKEDSQVL